MLKQYLMVNVKPIDEKLEVVRSKKLSVSRYGDTQARCSPVPEVCLPVPTLPCHIHGCYQAKPSLSY